ncbi:MAG: hypothetical protein KatS3mg090_0732 [Patescibacteria group bacterium]|nr:MAG: hypothetical protein KatS3mg090_0732 [Patescibacteria group bacterium]
MITISDFAKIELVIGQILSAEKINNYDKLLKLKVDIGDQTIQIVSGIAEHYKMEELIGKQIVVVKNLEHKTIAGVESQGMLLAVESDGKIILITPESQIKTGIKVK